MESLTQMHWWRQFSVPLKVKWWCIEPRRLLAKSYLLSQKWFVSSMAAIQRHNPGGKLLVFVNLEHFPTGHPWHNVIITVRLGVIQHFVQTEWKTFWLQFPLLAGIIFINFVPSIIHRHNHHPGFTVGGFKLFTILWIVRSITVNKMQTMSGLSPLYGTSH